MLKKKERKYTEDEHFYSLVEKMDTKAIEKFLLNKYKIGDKIDQPSAYGGLGNEMILTGLNVYIARENENRNYTNISIGNTGIYSTNYRKLAKIISHAKEKERN